MILWDGFETQMLLILAAMDAGQALEKREIACYDLISYTYDEDTGVGVTYQHYYPDEEMTRFNEENRGLGMKVYDAR